MAKRKSRKKKTFKTGDIIKVKVGGVGYDTIIDSDGVQRFKVNTTVRYLLDANGKIDMNALRLAYNAGAFNKRDYAEFHMMIGYSVSGFCELSPFMDWEVYNPLWD